MMNRQKGHVLVMTVLIMAIACIWFTLALTVSGNYFRVSRDEISLVRNRALAQGAMEEAIVILQRAIAEETLEDMAPVVIKRTVKAQGFQGELTASWRFTDQDVLRIEAGGVTETGKSTLTGEFIVARLPQSAGVNRPILLVESAKSTTLLANNGYDHLLKDDHAGGVTLNRAESLSGGLYCLGNGQNDWTMTVRALELSEGELYVQGHLYVTGRLEAPKIWVTGDLQIADGGSLICPEMWVGGNILREGESEALEASMGMAEMKNVLVLREMHR